MKTEFKPGQIVPDSGIYKVVHDTENQCTFEHEVTAVKGDPFPPCNGCGDHPRFILVRKAVHINDYPSFRNE